MKTKKAILCIVCIFISALAISQSKEKEEKEYYENGKLKETGFSIDGDATGIWKSYYENGKLKSIGKYIEGIEAGEWKFYDETGKLVETIKYFDGKQSDNIPPIQKFLDRVVKVDTYEDPTKVSQKISVKTFIVTLDSKSIKWKDTYSNIDWSNYNRYKYNEFEDFVVIEFFFYNDIKYENDDKEFGKKTDEVNFFSCKILPKDKNEVLEILKNWADKRGY